MYVDILHEVSKHTLPFIFRYFAIYVDILFHAQFHRGYTVFSREDILTLPKKYVFSEIAIFSHHFFPQKQAYYTSITNGTDNWHHLVSNMSFQITRNHSYKCPPLNELGKFISYFACALDICFRCTPLSGSGLKGKQARKTGVNIKQ